MTNLFCINDTNGASAITEALCRDLLYCGKPHLTGAEFGVAYGGGLQRIGRLWRCRGFIHGFDTFEGHPKQLGEPGQPDTEIMNPWYDKLGTEALDIEYQRKALYEDGLHNVVLHEGLIDENSLAGVPLLDYCLLDLDLNTSMRIAYDLVRPRMARGGYLCLHDVIPHGHVPGLYELYQEILSDFTLVAEYPESYLAVLIN